MYSNVTIHRPDTTIVREVERFVHTPADTAEELKHQMLALAHISLATLAYCNDLEKAIEALAKTSNKS